MTELVGKTTKDLKKSNILSVFSRESPYYDGVDNFRFIDFYLSLGNHEYFTGDADAWLQELKQLGIEPLHNSHVLISSKDSPEDKIYLAGVDDIQAESMK